MTKAENKGLLYFLSHLSRLHLHESVSLYIPLTQ